METGLRHRLKRVVRQMADQHRHLRPIQADLAEALARDGRVRPAQDAFARYRQAIDAHFALEGEMFFPALHGLRPDWQEALEALDREHEGLRDALSEVGRRIGAGTLAEAGAALAGFASELRDHEGREEQLVARLEG
jgi:hypothetical protein